MLKKSKNYYPPIVILISLTLLVSPTPIYADSITVCATGCDFTSIQAAIDDASTQPGVTIEVLDPVHTEPGILIDKDVSIQGQGATNTIVQAADAMETGEDRVFYIAPDTAATIRDVTIRYGNPVHEPESGGGIRNEGTLTVENCIITENSASAGGGILNDGTLTMVNTAIKDNVARGGYNRYIECSTGGGMKNMNGHATLVNTTISGNTAEGKGGGVHVSCQGILVLINSTISGNTTMNDGGGVYINGVGQFTHATITDNSAVNGGGIYVEGSGELGLVRGQLNYTHTLIAGNTATRPNYSAADCFLGDHATIATNIGNFVGDGTCETAYSGDPLLEPLADSVTDPIDAPYVPQTHPLQSDSPAVDAPTGSACVVETDQRGAPRPSGSGCDIGAFELQTVIVEEEVSPNNLCPGSAATLLVGLLAPIVAIIQRHSTKSANIEH